MWKGVSKNLEELAKDDYKLDNIINNQLIIIVKKEHPNDCEDYMETNAEKLNAIKNRIKEKYKKEVSPRITSLFSISDN